jgi:dTDP-4-dehydrorhamnose reductase
MRILVLGITGMLGNAVFRFLSNIDQYKVFGTTRTKSTFCHLGINRSIISDVNIANYDSIVHSFAIAQPDVVINCVGIVKQLSDSNNPLHVIPINTLLPHRLAELCRVTKTRLIHISTDCVFSGKKGGYIETDIPDATDLYGRSKLLGEVCYPNTITLRTSIIGHEIGGNKSLLNWFLSQEQSANGFRKAIFSGLPTVEIASIISNYVIPNTKIEGLYHVASEPISKYNLLCEVAKIYNKNIEIIPDDNVVIDRSLNDNKFRNDTGYTPPDWSELIRRMYNFQ